MKLPYLCNTCIVLLHTQSTEHVHETIYSQFQHYITTSAFSGSVDERSPREREVVGSIPRRIILKTL